jgi:predicted transport protein
MEKGLLEKTGKSLDQWIEIVKKAKLNKYKDIMNFLKSEHGFTHGYANMVALKARGTDAGSSNPADLIAGQYAKGKEHLKPIFDQLVSIIQSFGKDVEIAPKKSSVSMRVKRQFALIQPSTKTRIDLGLKFNDKAIGERLQGSGPFGTMCTHRVILTDIQEVDDELIAWIKEAYEQAR